MLQVCLFWCNVAVLCHVCNDGIEPNGNSNGTLRLSTGVRWNMCTDQAVVASSGSNNHSIRLPLQYTLEEDAIFVEFRIHTAQRGYVSLAF